jgi:DNA-binding transcriptional ArsR family regulator
MGGRQQPLVTVTGLQAMRALAHPVRLRIVELLHRSPGSASSLARALGIRYGSAQFHLRVLTRVGIAKRVGEEKKRGGTEVLYAIPHGFKVELDPNARPEAWRAMYRAHLADLTRRLEAAAAHPRPEDAIRSRTVVSDLRLARRDVPKALRAVDDLIQRLRAMSVHERGSELLPFTLVLNFFRAAPDENAQ